MTAAQRLFTGFCAAFLFPMHKHTVSPDQIQAKILKQTDDIAIIGMYGVIFDGTDLDGERFSKSTDFKLKRAKGAPVHIDHTFESYVEFKGKTYKIPAIEDEVGEIVEISPDDVGLYMQLQIEKSGQYWQHVERMMGSGKMGASTGTDYRSRKSADGTYEKWPINEVSLTLAPAEPRTADKVDQIKSTDQVKETITYKKDGKSVTISAANLPSGLTMSFGDGSGSTSTALETQIKSTADDSAEDTPEALEAESQSETEPVIEPEGELSPENLGEDPEDTMQNEEEQVEGDVLEAKTDDGMKAVLGSLGAIAKAMEGFNQRLEEMENTPVNDIKANVSTSSTPKYGLGDTESQHVKAWALGDTAETEIVLKASNVTDMNIGTPADGGNISPDGFYGQIIMKEREASLLAPGALPVFRIPGTENSVDIPVLDGRAGQDGEFIETAEAAAWDQDAPELGQKQSVLKWYTKHVPVSLQLLQSQGVAGGVEALLSRHFGMGMALTKNAALVNEVVTNGTSFVNAPATSAFTGGTSIAFGELEGILGNNILGPYMFNDNDMKWVMQRNTFWKIRTIVGADRQYWMNHNSDELLGYGVLPAQQVQPMGAGNNSVLFGNWGYVAYREIPTLTVQRNPYSLDINGQVRFTAHFACAMTVTQAEAIGYGAHA